jgi:hypothetical protein
MLSVSPTEEITRLLWVPMLLLLPVSMLVKQLLSQKARLANNLSSVESPPPVTAGGSTDLVLPTLTPHTISIPCIPIIGDGNLQLPVDRSNLNTLVESAYQMTLVWRPIWVHRNP